MILSISHGQFKLSPMTKFWIYLEVVSVLIICCKNFRHAVTFHMIIYNLENRVYWKTDSMPVNGAVPLLSQTNCVTL